MSELDVEALQAEVLWGQAAKDCLEPLRRNFNTFSGFTYQYLKMLNEPEPIAWSPKQMEEWDKSLRFVSGGGENSFVAEITESIRIMESFIKPFLRI